MIQRNRRYLSYLSTFSTNALNLKNPWMSAAWSFTFPGFGHFYTNNFLSGMILMIWEYAVNTLANINLSIYYSLLGNFDMAKEVVDLRWFLAYGAVYIFCMWDSYRRAVEFNRQYLLVYKNDDNILPFKMTTLGLNYLEKKDPWLSVGWSLFIPGMSAIYLHLIPSAIFGIFWYGVIAYQAHIFDGMLYSFWGQFDLVKEKVNPAWLLFLPSIFGFVAYQAYENAVELTRLFKMEQYSFFRKNYQNKNFKMPI